jgi:hypothetical protein
MSGLEFSVQFVGDAAGGAAEASLAELEIRVDRVALTEVADARSQSIRNYIRVPTADLARWLLVNWWRLRWEPPSDNPEWRSAHALPAIGGGHAWPDLDVACDGELVRVTSRAEYAADAAAIRYLREGSWVVPARSFEVAVDRLVAVVEARLAQWAPGASTIRELREELAEERADPRRARACRLQARAGLDPGAASEAWVAEAEALADDFGDRAVSECVATGLEPSDTRRVVALIDRAGFDVDLSWVPSVRASLPEVGTVRRAWEEGEAHARLVRARLGRESGPFLAQHFDLLGARIPRDVVGKAELGGAHVHGAGRAHVAIPRRQDAGRRFYMARVLGCALAFSGADEERFLPVTDRDTYLQKYERAFASELLCPWADLRELVAEKGEDEDALEDMAQHYEVSTKQLASTLANKRRVARYDLVA